MATKDKLIDAYLDELNKYDYFRSYTQLIIFLNNIPFEAKREMDENRVKDAEEFREKIGKRYGIPFNYFSPITVLEIMMSLADRFSGILYFPGDNRLEGFAELIELFLENLTLNQFDDNGFDEKQASKIIKHWMNLEYNRDGTNGNIVSKPGFNKLKSLDIWMQLNVVLCPNFDVDSDELIRHPFVR